MNMIKKGQVNNLGFTHLRYKIKCNIRCDKISVLDSWRFNANDFSVQPRKSYNLNYSVLNKVKYINQLFGIVL